MRIPVLFILSLHILTAQFASAGEQFPDGYLYVFPGSNARYVDPNTSVILRFKHILPGQITNLGSFIKVQGEQSGEHPGKTYVASDNRTVIFKPDTKYINGEKVNIQISPEYEELLNTKIEPISYCFFIHKEGSVKNAIKSVAKAEEELLTKSNSKAPMIMSNGVAVPSDFPHVTISVDNGASDDYIFVSSGASPTYKVIYDKSGDPVWYRKSEDRWGDFTVQPNGWITMFINDGFGGEGPGFAAFDQNFQFIKSMRATNSYITDEHDFYMFPDNAYMLIGKKTTTVDMSQIIEGGRPDAKVVETCIQEFTANDELVYIWRSWDHFDIRDLDFDTPTGKNIRFPHINAIWEDSDGHILISSRHLSEISKIDRSSGDFIWRLSGNPNSPNNEFRFIRDPKNGFRNQHAIRSVGNNRYTLFDNGNLHSPPASRAVEYVLDTVAMTATMVFQYQNTYGNGFTSHLGNSQQLPNGNTHINWAYGASFPIAAEVTQQGESIFEMWFDIGERCYRTLRHPWDGTCAAPYLLIEPNIQGVTMIFNKFGDSDIDYYKIYGEPNPAPTAVIDTSSAPLRVIMGLQDGLQYYFRVTAVDKNGNESEFSNEEYIVFNGADPGSNLIKNGDFTLEQDHWSWEIDNSASADLLFGHGLCRFLIDTAGNTINSISMFQDGIPLIYEQDYLLEFDARADGTRIVEIMLGKAGSPYTDYSKIGFSAITTDQQKFSFPFKMEEATDLNTRLLINAGTFSENLFLDNFSLSIAVPSAIDDNYDSLNDFIVKQNYPNPFKSSTEIKYYLPLTAYVKLVLYNAQGKKVGEFINELRQKGDHSYIIHPDRLHPGLYYYSFEAKPINSASSYKETKKMILIK